MNTHTDMEGIHSENASLQKAIVLLGPTAAGKTSWAINLAKEINGEIISADSRQIYKKMDIGTAKPEDGEWKRVGLRKSYYVQDVVHHLIDFLDPGKRFTAAQFRDRAVKYIKLAYKQGHIPIIAGGTGLYISALIDNYQIPRIAANKKLRESLSEKSNDDLMTLLRTLDADAAAQVDAKNKRRIVRALEVCIMSGEPFSKQKKRGEPLFDTLQIGIDVDRAVLHERINARADEMIKRGLVKEIEILLKQKYAWQLPSMSGVGYRQFQEYFEGTKSLDDTIEMLKRDTRRYARRQMTWFRRDKRIHWVKSYDEAKALVDQFLVGELKKNA